jgi:hypothetical protein
MDRERAITFTDDERCGLKHMNDSRKFIGASRSERENCCQPCNNKQKRM